MNIILSMIQLLWNEFGAEWIISVLQIYKSAMYDVESVLLSAYVVWQNDLLIHAMQWSLVDLYSWSRLVLHQASPWELSCEQSFASII